MWRMQSITSQFPLNTFKRKAWDLHGLLSSIAWQSLGVCLWIAPIYMLVFIIQLNFHHEVKKKRYLILHRIIYLCPLGPGSPLPSFLAYRHRISFSKSLLDSIQTYSSTMSKAEGNETNQPTNNRVKNPMSTECVALYKDTNLMGLCKKRWRETSLLIVAASHLLRQRLDGGHTKSPEFRTRQATTYTLTSALLNYYKTKLWLCKYTWQSHTVSFFK